ncbi:MAG TPA: 1-deoxy-D-xylulose-5-phosphate reductoisomerase [Candidatus Eisenbacteria bacterium]|nr:1-deoxy-D-xylulose-5-phosphate reductoisomerase [Candidatus Eisenbacteria bacterium]
MKKRVTILGSTGSVGLNTLKVIREFPERFEVAGLAAGASAGVLAAQAAEFRPACVYVRDSSEAAELKKSPARFFNGTDGLDAFTRSHEFDILVAASSGTTALVSVLDALRRGKRVALANKEILVMAGGLVMEAAKTPGAELLPVDSEHNAIFQCLQGERASNVERLVLTGSGGPLREVPADSFAGLPKETVINHPKWKMGKKISVDSATLMNKGLELIEAAWLFNVPIDRIQVLIHPEAVIHSMVEFKDGALLAQLGVTDMRLPIQYALTFPERLSSPTTARLDWSEIRHFTFAAPDRKKFPCLDLAYEAARRAGSAPCVLSAADEVAVGAFLDDRIGFVEIPRIIEKILSRHSHVERPDLSEIQSIHAWATEETRKLCQAH